MFKRKSEATAALGQGIKYSPAAEAASIQIREKLTVEYTRWLLNEDLQVNLAWGNIQN